MRYLDWTSSVLSIKFDGFSSTIYTVILIVLYSFCSRKFLAVICFDKIIMCSSQSVLSGTCTFVCPKLVCTSPLEVISDDFVTRHGQVSEIHGI